MKKFIVGIGLVLTLLLVGQARAAVITVGDVSLGIDSWGYSDENFYIEGEYHLYEFINYIDAGSGVMRINSTNFAETTPVTVVGNTATSTVTKAGDIRIDYTTILNNPVNGDGLGTWKTYATLTNLRSSTLTGSYYWYIDWDLFYWEDNDYSQFSAPNTIWTWDEDGGPPFIFHSPEAERWEIDTWPNLLNKLESESGGTVNLANATSPYGPGDATAAFQISGSFEPGESVTLSQTHGATPEPTSLFLLGSGLLGLVALGRKRNWFLS